MINKPHSQEGFTLLELVVVVLVMAILAAIAMTQYGRYAYRGRRADGKEILMRVANAQERYYATFNKYATDPVADLKLPSANSERGFYSVAITTTDATKNYTITATPITGQPQQKDVCGALSIDSTGTKLPVASDGTKNSNGPCW